MAPSELDLFAALARALSHSVRGDLAVITNDLSYFQTLLPAGETDRSKARCSRIGEAVSKLSSVRDGELTLAAMSMEELSRVVGAEGQIDGENRPFHVDREKLSAALSDIRVLVERAARGDVEVTISSDRTVSISYIAGAPGSEDREFDSLTELIPALLGERYVIQAVVADLILRAHGAICSCRVGAVSVTVVITFPESV